MRNEIAFLSYGGGHQDRCSSYGCDRPATGWLIAPNGDVVRGITCGECAVTCIEEYREKLGEQWRFAAGKLRSDPATDNISRVLPVRRIFRDGIQRRVIRESK